MKQKNPLIQLLKGEISLSVFLQGWVLIFRHILRKPFWLIMGVLLGVLGGLVYHWQFPLKHRATVLLGMEEEKATGWEGLMAQFGLEVGGTHLGGVFKGETLLTLFSTRRMIERSLLTYYRYETDSILIVERLLPHTGWYKKGDFAQANFRKPRHTFTRTEDSLLYLLYQHTQKELLKVERPDKKNSVIYVSCIHTDPLLAQSITETLVSSVSGFFIESLTKKARANLNVLYHEQDSIHKNLKKSFARSAIESDINVNPLRQSLQVNKNEALVDLQIAVTMYGEILKNTKLAEIGLRKQTPLIQIIETPQAPFDKIGLPLWKLLLLSGFLGLVLGAMTVWYRFPRENG